MAYLIAAIVMTCSVLEGHSTIASFFKYDIFAFFDLFLLAYARFICANCKEINAYLLTYLLYFMAVDLYSHCMRGTSSQCIGSGVMPPLDPKLLVLGTKLLRLENMYQTNTTFEYLQK